jgi:uncharacterized membrane protein
MTYRNTPAQADGFRAILAPHRSLSPAGFLLFMLAVGTVSFATGLVFLMLGAWPVLGFFGLDVLLVYIAFRLSYRSGRQFEVIELTHEQLTLTRVHPSGRSESFTFNPYWVRVDLERASNGHMGLSLSSHGRRLPFASFLTDDERVEFAAILRSALAEARDLRVV